MNRRQKIIYISGGIGVLLILIAVGMFLWQFQFLTFTDKARGFSIEYPAKWKAVKNFGETAVMFKAPLDGPLDVYPENVTVVLQDISQKPKSLMEYTDKAIDQMETVFLDNFVLEESTAVATLGGYPAYKIIFTGKGPDQDIMMYMTWTVIDEHWVYQVSYSALPSQFEKYDLIVERMLASFKILR